MMKEEEPAKARLKEVNASRVDVRRARAFDQHVELKAMAKLNEQSQNLKKSINVFTPNPAVQNPFLQNRPAGSAQQQGSQSQPSSRPPANGGKPKG
jgi:hypothetical protein